MAGTTEKIFEEKKDLYDVYVDNQNVKTCRDGLKPLLRLSAADREKYRKLTEQRCQRPNGKFQTKTFVTCAVDSKARGNQSKTVK